MIHVITADLHAGREWPLSSPPFRVTQPYTVVRFGLAQRTDEDYRTWFGATMLLTRDGVERDRRVIGGKSPFFCYGNTLIGDLEALAAGLDPSSWNFRLWKTRLVVSPLAQFAIEFERGDEPPTGTIRALLVLSSEF